ncbi:M56/M15 family metallopeptidase [Mucilaginibacter sp. CAU 1740]|uniref:M56/M15 family metallopeptidase n=1 Tax=Mucilaginibacter sp. CAU 1740 TaxID=3140365 RepID=UPI00325B77E3
MVLFNYLGAASACMAICYTLYILLFRRLTFFSVNRFYLLFTVVVSLIIPALHIKVRENETIKKINQTIAISHDKYPEAEHFIADTQGQDNVNWYSVATSIYIVVCVIMLLKAAYLILKIVKQTRRHGERMGNNLVVLDQSKSNSSFFHVIFISNNNVDGQEMEQIIAHEKTHARLFHSADNLFIAVVKAIFWFNPVIYLIARALNEVHEFEVDNDLKQFFDPKKYASLLLRLSSPAAMQMTNQFSAYSLKRRVAMLFKPNSPAFKLWAYLAIVPVLLLSGYYFSTEKVYGNELLKKHFVLVLDAGHGGSQEGAIAPGGYREKDLSLQIVKQISDAATKRGIQTILTRNDDHYLDLQGRVTNKADAFISIHLNAPGVWTRHTNGMEILVERNSLYPFSGRLADNVKNSLQQLETANANHGVDITETSPNNTLYVLRHNKAPAILIELGFMTDKADLDYILNTKNQHEIAEKIIDAVVTYGNQTKN